MSRDIPALLRKQKSFMDLNLIGYILLGTSALYVVAGISEAARDNYWWFGFWSAYACANIFWLKATHAF